MKKLLLILSISIIISSCNKNGLYKEYDSDNNLIQEENYKDGELDGWSKYYSPGPFYTSKAVEIPREEVTRLIQEGEGGEGATDGGILNIKKLYIDGEIKIIVGYARFILGHPEANAQKRSEGEYKDGKQIYQKLFYWNGQLQSTQTYVGGEINGLYKYWSENGELLTEGNKVTRAVAGDSLTGKEGLWKEWYENGQLESEINFQRDVYNGLYKKYHSNGRIESEGHYKEGEKNGWWKYYNRWGELISERIY